MGFFAGLNDEKYDRQYSDRDLARRIFSYFGPQKIRLVLVSLLVITLAGIGAALPVVVSNMVGLLEGQPTLTAISLVGLTVWLIGIGLWGLNWARRSLVIRAVGDVVLDLRTRAFRAAAEHDLSFYDQFSSGRIVSRITSDTNDFGQLVIIVTDVGAQFVQAFILGVVLFRTDLKLSLLLMAFLPFIFAIASVFRIMARRVTRRGMKAMSDVNAAIKETISGISIAKNFRQEESIFQSFDESNQQSYQVNVQRGFVLSLVFPTLNALGGIFIAILIYVGGLIAAQGIVCVGGW
jgi:ATP-binding cassette subfamily B protein